ncbi:hypothetical protein [Azospirillum palustre]
MVPPLTTLVSGFCRLTPVVPGKSAKKSMRFRPPRFYRHPTDTRHHL